MPRTLEDLSLSRLQEKAVALGLDGKDAEMFNSKRTIIVTIHALQKARASGKKIDSSTTANQSPKERKETEEQYKGKREIMRDILAKQKKVDFFAPLDGKERKGIIRKELVDGKEEWVQVSGAVDTVTINGFKTLVPKGVRCRIPIQVAEILYTKYNMESEVAELYDIDRIDPETRRPVRDALGG